MTDNSIGNDKTINTDGKSSGHNYALHPGDNLGQYRIIRSLGAGDEEGLFYLTMDLVLAENGEPYSTSESGRP